MDSTHGSHAFSILFVDYPGANQILKDLAEPFYKGMQVVLFRNDP